MLLFKSLIISILRRGLFSSSFIFVKKINKGGIICTVKLLMEN
nr:MAG TPA: hypothetical protein [Caudoviricetes sp.]